MFFQTECTILHSCQQYSMQGLQFNLTFTYN
jgi:hypothetical protein